LNKKEIKSIIIRKIKTMELEMENLKLLAQPIEPENSIGRISRMDAINNKSINDRMLRKAQEKLKYLKLNLKSLENNDFGFCMKCKKQININRIKLIPETRKCINCS
jgi:DnaK suppressor protein